MQGAIVEIEHKVETIPSRSPLLSHRMRDEPEHVACSSGLATGRLVHAALDPDFLSRDGDNRTARWYGVSCSHDDRTLEGFSTGGEQGSFAIMAEESCCK